MTDASPSGAADARLPAMATLRERARSAAPDRIAVATALVFVLVATAGGAMAVSEPREIALAEAVGETVTLCGRLARYGNEPHSYLAILVDPASPPRVERDSDTRVRLERETLFRLRTDVESTLNPNQGREIRVTGVVERAASPGMPAEIRVVSWEPAPPDDR